MNKFLNLFSKFFLFFSLIIFVSYLFKSFLFLFNKNEVINFKYLIFFLIIFILSLIFYLSDLKIKEKLFLISFSLTISLLLLEGLISYLEYSKSVEYHAKKDNKKYDSRLRYEYYLDRLTKEEDIVVSIPPFITHREYFKNPQKFNFLPLGGISNRKTIFCNEAGFFVEYQSDRYGFNNPDNEWSKNDHYLYLGDSYLHGVCVAEKNNIVGVLRSKLKDERIGLINLGQRGNGPLSELGGLIEYKDKLNIKKIFWLYYEGNDLKNLRYESKIDKLNYYLMNQSYKQFLINNQNQIDEKLNFVLENRIKFEKNTFYYMKQNKILTFLKLKKLRKYFFNIFSNKTKDYNDELIKLEKILHRANQIALSINSEFYFVYIPTYNRLNKLSMKLDESYYDNIKNITKNLNLKFIDLSELILKKEKNPKTLFPYGLPKHFNEYGYNLISQILLENTH